MGRGAQLGEHGATSVGTRFVVPSALAINEFLLAHKDDPELRDAFKVMVDVDSTWYPLLDVMATREGGARVDIRKIETWSSLSSFVDGGSKRMLEIFGECMDFAVMREHPPFPGAVEAAQLLKAHGAELHVTTHRKAEFADDTARWMEMYGLPYDSLRCDLGFDKLAWCRENGISILVDDHPELLAEAAEAGFEALSLHWPYNASVLALHNLHCASNWNQLGGLVLAAIESRLRRQLAARAA